ncbi:MAG: DUF1214 domain-containing protein [bacterium]|nr:hypothetical protein [Deltaproteobacteria bacterium]MCP4906474.1 DUF1214 domain-containing protein [bacterium]
MTANDSSEHPKLNYSKDDPGQLWEEFCDSLKRAGNILRRPETPQDERTIAEGYRHLLRMVRIGFENTFELADLAAPQLTPMVGRMVQYEGITSDARYLHAFIDGSAAHVIRGTRGEAPLIEFGTYNGKMGIHDPSHLLGSITEEKLQVGSDGRIEVVLSPEEHSGNWIRTDAETRYVMIRQYASEWDRLTPGRFEIARTDGATPAPPFDLEEIRDGLERTAAFSNGNPLIWAGISDYWANFAVNRFVPEVDADALTDIAPPSGHHFCCGYFDLGEDEALVITFQPGEAGFWSLGLASYWYETIGYGRKESHLNSGTVNADPNGRVRVVISQSPPPESAGIQNWLDPKGHQKGTMVFRWSRPKSPMPDFECERVAQESLS